MEGGHIRDTAVRRKLLLSGRNMKVLLMLITFDSNGYNILIFYHSKLGDELTGTIESLVHAVPE